MWIFIQLLLWLATVNSEFIVQDFKPEIISIIGVGSSEIKVVVDVIVVIYGSDVELTNIMGVSKYS